MYLGFSTVFAPMGITAESVARSINGKIIMGSKLSAMVIKGCHNINCYITSHLPFKVPTINGKAFFREKTHKKKKLEMCLRAVTAVKALFITL